MKNKASGAEYDPVTAADRAAERIMRAAIAKNFPEHGILGEEFAAVPGAGSHQWVLDPIDGTRAFIMGSPLWGTLIGLVQDGKPVLGVMDQPFTRERYWSDAGTSYMRTPDGEQTITTRPCAQLADAILSTTHPDLFAAGEEVDAFGRLKAQVRMTRYGGDCYSYCLLAGGFIDLVVEAGLKPYDIVALIPIIERAGGRITTWDGKPATAGGRIVASGDARLHEAAMTVLNR